MSPRICFLITLVGLVGCGEETELDPDLGPLSSRDMSRRAISLDMLMPLNTDSGLALIDGTLPMIDSATVTRDAGTSTMPDAAVGPVDAAVADAEVEVDAAAQEVSPTQIGSDGRRLSGLPFHGLYDYSQLGIIYLAEELSAAGAGAGPSR